MNLTPVLPTRVLCGIALVATVCWPGSSWAQTPGRAEVQRVRGRATYTTNESPARPLTTDVVLTAGALIKTGPNSTVDLFLGRSVGLVRIAENSTLVLDKLMFTATGADNAVDVQLHLPEGEMYFDVNKLSKASRYEIKLPTGVAGIRGTRGSFSFRQGGNTKPPVVLLEGKLIFVHAAADGAVTSYVMSAPPAVYFTPAEGVQPAPLSLQRQVEQDLDDARNTEPKKQERAEGEKPPFSLQPEPVLSSGSGTPAR